MKKNYLLWTVCMALLSGYGLPQDAYVTGPAKVKVNQQTLVFFGEDLKITEDASSDANVDNLGNIVVVGDFSNAAADNNYSTDYEAGKNFMNRYFDETTYGQLIVNDVSAAAAMGMEKVKINPDDFYWGQFSIPFDYANADDATKRLFGGLSYYNGWDRYRNSMMVWDNLVKPQFNHLSSTSTLTPGEYVILNLMYAEPGIKGLMTGTGNLSHYGKALNKVITVPFNGNYYPAENWDEWKEFLNDHNERYKTYISDAVRDENTDNDYGKYSYQFGNPYSSNITLTYLNDSNIDDGNSFPDLIAVAQGDEIYWSGHDGSYHQTMKVATYNGNVWSGEPSALIVKPFRPFILMFSSNQGQQVFTFSDKIKTFSMNPDDDLPVYTKKTYVEPDNELGTAAYDNSEMSGKNLGATFTTSSQARSRFYQAKFSLYDENDNPTGNRFFLVVSGIVKNGEPNTFEAEYVDFENRTGFYLDQENADGTPVKISRRKMHINSINPSYTNKPIPLFFNRQNNDLNGYYLKADLFYGSIFNELSQDANNYADGNSFFFYDRTKDVLLPVTTDFVYHVRPARQTLSGSQYELYWNGANTNRDGMENGLEMLTDGATIVYKDRNMHMVKFNNLWSSAEVKVYDISGRNVLTHENVDTSNLLHLQLPVRGVYVVKITADTGEIYTQKIIK